jgi:hypothetical protein
MPSFEQSVFINCPLDDNYRRLLRPMVFTVLYLGKSPRIALEREDSGEARINKIVELVQKSKFSIHDLSRCKADEEGELSRMNMPLELGLDLGCRLKGGKWKTKRCLILETKRYRYQAAISDLSNSDICSHNDQPEDVIRCVRNWLVREAGADAVSASSIIGAFLDFNAANFDQLTLEAFTPDEIENIGLMDLKERMVDWLRERVRKTGIRVSGRPGFVKSPYAKSSGFVDVRGVRRGSNVKCPYTGKIFICP